MDLRQQFTDEEWMTINDALAFAGMWVSKMDMGVISFWKEFEAGLKTIATASERYPDNNLIQAISDSEEETPTNENETRKSMSVEDVFAAINKAVSLVEEKAPSDADGYRQLMFEMAENCANASGGFLGLGDAVSDDEADYLKRLRTELRLG